MHKESKTVRQDDRAAFKEWKTGKCVYVELISKDRLDELIRLSTEFESLRRLVSSSKQTSNDDLGVSSPMSTNWQTHRQLVDGDWGATGRLDLQLGPQVPWIEQEA